MLTALVTVYVCLSRKSVIALTGGKEQAVISLIVLECRIAMHLGPATEKSIPRFVSTVRTIRWVLLVNFPVLTVMNTLLIAFFASVIHATVDLLVTSSALDVELATRAFASVTQDGKAQHAKS